MRAYNLLTGVAVADALGYPVEFKRGLTTSDLMRVILSGILVSSDDTQMTLFLCEAINEWSNGAKMDFREVVTASYLRWYRTQVGKKSPMDYGLMSYDALYSQEVPGNTCMNSMRSLFHGVLPDNDSKGNGTVMRCSPIALYVHQRMNGCLDTASLLAGIDADITHKHPYAHISSRYLCVLLTMCMSGVSLRKAVEDTTRYILSAYPEDHQALKWVGLVNTQLGFRMLRNKLGGWVAEEALALAIGSALHGETFLEVVCNAATIDGDSDTVAAIAGSIAASVGLKPDRDLVESLNLLDPIKYASTLPVWTE